MQQREFDSPNCFVKQECSLMEQIMGTSIQVCLGIGISTQVVISTVAGQSLSSMWNMINALQVLSYMITMTLYYPTVLLNLISFVNIVNMENPYFTEWYLLHIDESKITESPSWDYRFENQGIGSTNILLNCADIFFALILVLLFLLLMVGFSCL